MLHVQCLRQPSASFLPPVVLLARCSAQVLAHSRLRIARLGFTSAASRGFMEGRDASSILPAARDIAGALETPGYEPFELRSSVSVSVGSPFAPWRVLVCSPAATSLCLERKKMWAQQVGRTKQHQDFSRRYLWSLCSALVCARKREYVLDL